MRNLKLILSTFTNQQNHEDCGMACLLSVFKYAGIDPALITPSLSQTSLLDIHKLATKAGVTSRCVRMDMETLKSNPNPSILHIINELGQPHFIVHYGFNRNSGLHLIGDPDKKLEFIPDSILLNKWKSYAALYIENLKPVNKWSYVFFPWNHLFGFRFIPKILWLSVPVLNLFAAFLGLAISLIIQKSLDPGFINNKNGFFVVLFSLLILLSLARSLINYLTQSMMIGAGTGLDDRLSNIFLRGLFHSFKNGRFRSEYYLKTVTDQQKIHQAASLIVGVVFSDGVVVAIMLGCLYYFQPCLVILQIVVFILMLLTIDHYVPIMVISNENTQIRSVNCSDSSLNDDRNTTDKQEFEILTKRYFCLSDAFAKKARSVSVISSKITLVFELFNAANIILILIFGVYKLQVQAITYERFLFILILCYGSGMLMTKICNQLFIISQAADTIRKNVVPDR